MEALTMEVLLRKVVEMGASDLHITAGSPPMIRVHGRLIPIEDMPKLSPSDTKRLCYSILTDSQRQRLEEELELDFSFGIKGLARFRGNVFFQRGTVAGAFRTLPFKIPQLSELGLPPVVETFTEKPKGLILVTGPTGSGKSTTLASLIDRINNTKEGHIITIEDPIEFIHQHKKCIVNQREVSSDTTSFAKALKASLRQDPDVVLIGEMRDLETMETALTMAETGHLTFATLHTNSATETINRIVNAFPSERQEQVRVQLSFVLEGIISQKLLPRKDGKGRVLAAEVLVPTPAIRNLIRENKIHQVYSQMQVGQTQHGMQTMNQALLSLVRKGLITPQTALDSSPNREELRQMMERGGAASPGTSIWSSLKEGF